MEKMNDCGRLSVTRRLMQSIVIGDHIKVTVTRISARKVEITVTAPREVSVWREELYERIAQEKIMNALAAERKGNA